MARKKEIDTKELQAPAELKKHVAVIHSSSKITLLQRKIANALLFNAYENLQKYDEHEISISTLCRLIGYDSNDSKTIKKSLVNLLSTVIEWNLVDGEKIDSEGVWNASSIIADASIKGGICTYSYSNKMRKLLYRPHMYGRLNMQVQAQFQSSYGLALYENCNRYQDIGQTPWLDLVKFRKLMGVEEHKYKVFRDFKNRVLDKAVEEVNKYSPIQVDAQLKKQNRKVTAIQFLIKLNHSQANQQISAISSVINEESLKQGFGLSKKQAQRLMTQYDPTYIQGKIKLIETSPSYLNGKIKHLANYLLKALEEDYQPAKKVEVKPRPVVERTKQTEQLKRHEYQRYYEK
jgi:plasmid replication initiation protein